MSEPEPDDVPRRDSAACLLVLLNVAVFLYSRGRSMGAWHLHHGRGFHAVQLLTAMFCHRDFAHLSSNMFGLYVFGRSAEARVGSLGLVVAYLICGGVGNAVSKFLVSGNVVSLGASGAVFGLFIVATLATFRLSDPRALVEFFVLGQFAWSQVSGELAGPARKGVDKAAHVAGAAGGLLAFWVVRRRRRQQGR